MKYNPELHHRRSIRLRGYDYSQAGAYFVTICTQNRECLFGENIDAKMVLNAAGKTIEQEWLALPQRFVHIDLDEFVVMPNHFHGIVLIIENEQVGTSLVDARGSDILTNRAGTRPAPTTTTSPIPILGDIIGAFKSITTNEYIRGVKQNNWRPFQDKLWQRNYFERVIRVENEMNQIREYILNNPAKWQEDKENPENWQ